MSDAHAIYFLCKQLAMAHSQLFLSEKATKGHYNVNSTDLHEILCVEPVVHTMQMHDYCMHRK